MKKRLQEDMVAAVKGRDRSRVEVVRFLISLIDKRELQLPPGQMTEAEEAKVLAKELKNKEEARGMFLKAGRNDLVETLDYEIGVVKEYLPKEMTESELESIVDEAILETNDFGKVMRIVMVKVAGRIGGEKIAPLVKEKISNI